MDWLYDHLPLPSVLFWGALGASFVVSLWGAIWATGACRSGRERLRLAAANFAVFITLALAILSLSFWAIHQADRGFIEYQEQHQQQSGVGLSI